MINNTACFICKRKPRGYGWMQPYEIKNKKRLLRKFCSLNCQKLHGKLINIEDKSIMTNIHKMEPEIVAKILPDVAKFISKNIGMNKAVSSYTKNEITGLINEILTSYFYNLNNEINEEIAEALK